MNKSLLHLVEDLIKPDNSYENINISGIKIDSNPPVKSKIIKDKTKVSFGFYYSFIVSIIIAIFLLRLLYFTQDIIIEKLPLSEVYINYLFESINNMIDIIQNLFSNY